MLLPDIDFSQVFDLSNAVVVGNPRPRYVFQNGKITDMIDGYVYPVSDGKHLQNVAVAGDLRKFKRYEAILLIRPRFTYISKNRELMAMADDIRGVEKNE